MQLYTKNDSDEGELSAYNIPISKLNDIRVITVIYFTGSITVLQYRLI